MRIAADLLGRIVDHATRDAPHECCGLVATVDGAAVAVHPMVNERASALSFRAEAISQLRATNAIEDAGHDIGAIYHSHPRTAAYPSPTDVNMARKGWLGVEWLIVGLGGDEPEVRSYRIGDDGAITEVEVEIGVE